MTKPSPDTRITHATVEAAMRDARNGIEWEHRDPECTGLILRARGGAVSWNFRGPRSGGKHQRWMLGAHTVSPRDARQRAWAVRTYIQRGIDPTTMLTELVTGATPAEQLDLRVTNKPSWKWEKAIARFLAGIADNAREATIGDYRATLQNTPQLAKFRGRWVCDILREEIEEVVEEIRLRGVKTHHKKVLVVTRRFFNWMAEGARRRETSVAVNFLHAAKAGAPMRDVEGRRVVNKGIPDALPIGRALAIARSDVLGALPSLGIIPSTRRRRNADRGRATVLPDDTELVSAAGVPQDGRQDPVLGGAPGAAGRMDRRHRGRSAAPADRGAMGGRLAVPRRPAAHRRRAAEKPLHGHRRAQ